MIGITGSIASGKSTICNIIKSLGYTVYDCDEISHEIMENNMDVIKMIDANFKGVVINNKVDRKKLGNIVFHDDYLLEKLNRIIHPLVIKKLNEIENTKYTFVEVPLLFEAHMETMFDKIITVFTTKENQLKRLIKRNGLTENDAINLINKQMDLQEKCDLSDFVIDNNEDLDDVKLQIEKIIKNL